MFFLPEQLNLGPFSHVILSPEGRYVALSEGSSVYLLKDEELQTVSRPDVSLFDRYSGWLKFFPSDEADCLGLGAKDSLPPVLLHLTVRDGYGLARAIFHRQPTQLHYELLKAIGVSYEGGYTREGFFIASFRNQLPTHIHAGALAGYRRTANCNEFFLNHGEIDPSLEAGLIKASESRTDYARRLGLAAAARLARSACQVQLAMICQPPAPQARFAYGDLVPLGFLLNALERNPDDSIADASARLRVKLIAGQHQKLWPFHTGRLITATDSALILQGLPSVDAIQALERFSDGQGGYYPQLWAEKKEPDRMLINEANEHWCQPDFATTCLVRGLRAEAGLPTVTPLHSLEERFDTRSGLYFANPYLTDWALATAIRDDADARELRRRLLNEILAAMNEDYSFGTFDVALSTSFAILTLAALGCRGRLLRLAQLRLLEMMDPASGTWPECVPFYSTFLSPKNSDIGAKAAANQSSARSQIIEIDGLQHELSLYFDHYRIIATSAAVLALSEACLPQRRDIPLRSREAHRRYRSRTQEEYIVRFALPAYVEERENRSLVL